MIKKKIAFGLHITIVVFEIIATIISVMDEGIGFFKYYTNLSNLMALVVSAICAFYLFLDIKYKTNNIPKSLKLLRFYNTIYLTITFIVVLFILAPARGIEGVVYYMTYGCYLFHHTLVPIISFALLWFEDHEVKFIHTLHAMVPTILYGIVTLFLNYFGYIYGPYPFLMITYNPPLLSVLYLTGVVAIAYLIGLGIYFITKKLNK